MADEEWRANVDRRLSALEKTDAVDQVHRTNIDRRLSDIEGTLTWLVRLIIGAIILAFIGFVIQGGIQ